MSICRNKINEKLIRSIQMTIESKRVVLLDCWSLTADQVQELFPEVPVIRVALYYSLPVADQMTEEKPGSFYRGEFGRKSVTSNNL